jgi:hypothetical protein
LLHYFDLPEPPPHKWFAYRRGALEQLAASYEKNAAHIDLFSFPTKLRNLLNDDERRIVGQFIESGSGYRLTDLLRLASKARVILVKDYTFSKSTGETAKTFDFISKNQTIAKLFRSRGIQLQTIDVERPNHFETSRLRAFAPLR